MRTLKDGTVVKELESAKSFTIMTKCPDKWLLIDRETGEAYVPYDMPGSLQWKKIYNAEWNINA